MSERDDLQKVIYQSNRGNTQIDLQGDRRLQGSQLAWAGYAADALIAAGYGLTVAAKAEALEEAAGVAETGDGGGCDSGECEDWAAWLRKSAADLRTQ